MLLDQLHAQKTAIAALGSQYGARRIRVFGSVARGEEGPDSDVDSFSSSSTMATTCLHSDCRSPDGFPNCWGVRWVCSPSTN